MVPAIELEPMMATNVKLPDDLVEKARRTAAAEHRSVPKQIEYYYRIAQIAEENPDLPFSLIRDLLLADAEEATTEYSFN
jgi:hypothetical protein